MNNTFFEEYLLALVLIFISLRQLWYVYFFEKEFAIAESRATLCIENVFTHTNGNSEVWRRGGDRDGQ